MLYVRSTYQVLPELVSEGAERDGGGAFVFLRY